MRRNGPQKSSLAVSAPVAHQELPSSEQGVAIVDPPSRLITAMSLGLFVVITAVTVGLLGAEIKMVGTAEGTSMTYQFSLDQLFENIGTLTDALFAQASTFR